MYSGGYQGKEPWKKINIWGNDFPLSSRVAYFLPLKEFCIEIVEVCLINVGKSSISSINLFFLRDFAGWIFNPALFIKEEQQDQWHHLRNVEKKKTLGDLRLNLFICISHFTIYLQSRVLERQNKKRTRRSCQVEVTGIEPVSKHVPRKLSTCLFCFDVFGN